MKIVELIESADDFEKLAVSVARHLLGEGVTGFGSGKDGGRDGIFRGRANNFPSNEKCWETQGKGAVIIQAKHTEKTETIGSPQFKNILAQEVEKLKKLKAKGELSYYLLITNRKLTGNKHSEIIDYLAQETGLPHDAIFVLGNETLNPIIENTPSVLPTELTHLAPILASLKYKRSLDEVVDNDDTIIRTIKLCSQIIKNNQLSASGYLPITERCNLSDKNKLNNTHPGFGRLLEHYFLSYTTHIDQVLANPNYTKVKELYSMSVITLDFKSLNYPPEVMFNVVLDNLITSIINENPTIKGTHDELMVRVMVYYMYWNCDIGQTTPEEDERAKNTT